MTDPILFAPLASREFGERVASALGTALSPMEEREFEGGEHKTRPLVSVRGQRVFVLQSLSGDAAGSANDRLCRLLFFISGLKDSGAASVTACIRSWPTRARTGAPRIAIRSRCVTWRSSSRPSARIT